MEERYLSLHSKVPKKEGILNIFISSLGRKEKLILAPVIHFGLPAKMDGTIKIMTVTLNKAYE